MLAPKNENPLASIGGSWNLLLAYTELIILSTSFELFLYRFILLEMKP